MFLEPGVKFWLLILEPGGCKVVFQEMLMTVPDEALMLGEGQTV